MINLNKINNVNWEKINIAVLGAGISGLGAVKLAQHLNANVLLSDVKKSDVNLSLASKFKYEYSGHSDEVLKSDLIIKSPGIPNEIDIIKQSKNKKIPLVSEIEFASWFSKSDIIAITGSNGKTTTVQLVFDMFKQSHKDVLLGGNIGISYSENVLHEIKSKKKYIHILEISSYQAEHLYHFNPQISCILNISEDHMNRYDSMDDYIDAKLNITKNLTKETKLVYNKDDEILSSRIQSAKNIIPFSFDNGNIIKYKGNTIKTSLVGVHNFYNILAAITIADLYKIKWRDIACSIMNFTPLPHRIECFLSYKGVQYINDSKSTTIASTTAAIKCFKNIILIVGGESKGNININELLKCIQHENIKNIIIYGDVGKILKKKLNIDNEVSFYLKFDKAINKAIQLSSPEDSVLLSPGFSSFDQFKNYKERGNTFKKIIKKNRANKDVK